MDRDSLESLLGQGFSLAEIGRRFDRHEATVSYWVQKHGLAAVNRDAYAAKGALGREELEGLIEGGLSTRQIADAMDRSQTTIRHWLREYGLKTKQAERRSTGGRRERRVMRECAHHGLTEFQRRSPSGYRCLRCRSEAVVRRRRYVKRLLVEEAGGACQICAYDRCIRALHFHHLDPAEKQFALSLRGVTRSLARARREAKKCILLCSNCHAEIEEGLVSPPSVTSGSRAIVSG
jgi:transposase